mmetsp:Transcript_22898/g.42002  ORF Transcript_22898/g.42002 Transcript_22898/m.42002 type:complete len:130 (-) Transcript_22898:119-508(-)
MSTELVLRHGDGRVRVTFQHAPMWECGVEPGSCPSLGLKLFRALVSKEKMSFFRVRNFHHPRTTLRRRGKNEPTTTRQSSILPSHPTLQMARQICQHILDMGTTNQQSRILQVVSALSPPPDCQPKYDQ